jgi:hypothetical protein
MRTKPITYNDSRLQYYLDYGDSFKIERPTGSGNSMNLFEVAREIANRLTRIFLRNQAGRRDWGLACRRYIISLFGSLSACWEEASPA